jgi:hypothetical protein
MIERLLTNSFSRKLANNAARLPLELQRLNRHHAAILRSVGRFTRVSAASAPRRENRRLGRLSALRCRDHAALDVPSLTCRARFAIANRNRNNTNSRFDEDAIA